MTLRAMWQPRIDAGSVVCARCGLPIWPGQPWDLGHVIDRARGGRDDDGTYPEHARCNRAAGGRLGQAMTRRTVRVPAPDARHVRRWDV